MIRPTVLSAALAMAAAALLLPTSAAAAPACERRPEVRVLHQASGILESVGVDRKGKLIFTSSATGEVMKLRKPGAEPKVITTLDGPGGIIFKKGNGNFLVGFLNNAGQAADGTANPEAGLMNVNPKTGETKIHVEGLQMANGVARGPGRTIFASNDIAGGIDRIHKRVPALNWAPVNSANGMIVDRAREALFVNQTFQPAAITRVPLANQGAASVHYAAPPPDFAAGFDGLTRDGRDRLYIAANGAGQVWRVDGPGQACVLADRDPFPSGPSDITFGRKRGHFPAKNLYVTTFGGELLELVGTRG